MFFEFSTLKYFPIRLLTLAKKCLDGRNHRGERSIISRGGGLRRRVRLVDFQRLFWFLPFIVLRYEYDPLRSGFIVLVCYLNGVLGYSLASVYMEPGVLLGVDLCLFKYGSVFRLGEVPLGSFVFGLESNFGLSSQVFTVLRSAGAGGQILKKQANFVLVRLPSGEERIYDGRTLCNFGFVSNMHERFRVLRKAGVTRYLGRRPHVRGVAKNPVDHPHGGGEGRTSGGRPSVNVKGIYTKGVRTSNAGRIGVKYIIRNRRVSYK